MSAEPETPLPFAGAEAEQRAAGSCDCSNEGGQAGAPDPSVAIRTTSVTHRPQQSQGSDDDPMHSCSHKGCEMQKQGPTPRSLMPM